MYIWITLINWWILNLWIVGGLSRFVLVRLIPPNLYWNVWICFQTPTSISIVLLSNNIGNKIIVETFNEVKLVILRVFFYPNMATFRSNSINWKCFIYSFIFSHFPICWLSSTIIDKLTFVITVFMTCYLAPLLTTVSKHSQRPGG